MLLHNEPKSHQHFYDFMKYRSTFEIISLVQQTVNLQ